MMESSSGASRVKQGIRPLHEQQSDCRRKDSQINLAKTGQVACGQVHASTVTFRNSILESLKASNEGTVPPEAQSSR